jgi:hypothetical protein
VWGDKAGEVVKLATHFYAIENISCMKFEIKRCLLYSSDSTRSDFRRKFIHDDEAEEWRKAKPEA